MENRVRWLRLLVGIALTVVLLRVAQLQLIRGSAYRLLAERNRLRLVPEQAPRGPILDRHGRVLATTQTVFRVALIPQELEDLPSVLAHVGSVVHAPVDGLQRELERQPAPAFLPVTLVNRVPKEVAFRLEEERWRWPGLLVQADAIRHYPRGSCAAHLLGYVGQPTAEELQWLKAYGIPPRSLVGRVGLEQWLDAVLRGRDGGWMVEVNHRSRRVRVIGQRRPEAGARVVLTIDAQLQSTIEQAFGTQPGAAAVLDPRTGEVLALVSAPAFSPESFATLDTQAIRRILSDPGSPLMNRATAAAYQPGSIVKLVTAAAGLEHRLMAPATAISCAGSTTIGDRAFHCWKRDGHGPLTMPEALAHSCNVYFMQVGRSLGASRLRAALAQAGFARSTGWPLPERAGHLPERRLTEGEVALLAIGQGEIEVTVMAEAAMGGAIANGGRLMEPWVVRTVAGRPAGRPVSRGQLGWSRETIAAVRAGMVEAVRHPSGTAHRALSPDLGIAGKTGTAQTHVPGRNHGWFVGFCPVEQPRVAMAIVAEFGGSGGELPAQIGRLICESVGS